MAETGVGTKKKVSFWRWHRLCYLILKVSHLEVYMPPNPKIWRVEVRFQSSSLASMKSLGDVPEAWKSGLPGIKTSTAGGADQSAS